MDNHNLGVLSPESVLSPKNVSPTKSVCENTATGFTSAMSGFVNAIQSARYGKRIRTSLLVGTLSLCFLGWLQTATAQVPATSSPQLKAEYDSRNLTSTQVNDVIRQGEELEREGRWGDALGLYQQTLKSNPKQPKLNRRRSIARIHYDLERRYSDASFMETIRSSDESTALNVYAEVLLKVQSYYVDEPNWAELASFGLTSLEVAMTSPDFRYNNLSGISETQIRDAILQTRRELESVTVNGRHDCQRVAGDTARSLQSRLGIPVQATIYEFVCGAISALDPYSAFMSSSQYGEQMSQIEGNFVGLGVELRTHEDHLEIVSVIEGGPAESGGLVRGDQVIAVDNQQVVEIGSERAADMLRGPEGSYVSLTVDRNQAMSTLQFQRRRVEIPSVDQVQIVDRQSGVGYIRLTNFQKTTTRDFDAAMWKLHRQGMRSLIVDVRGNPGGLLTASVEIADRFVHNGVIVSTRGRNQMENYTHRANAESTWKVPLVVLIDENSASASEIFAAAIRDHQRGTIVGNQSYGKGSVQGIFPLNVSGGGVRLTTAKFYSPNGQAISEVGVKADVIVRETAKLSNETVSDSQDDAGLRLGIRQANQLVTARDANRRRTSNRRSSPLPAATYGETSVFAGR
jgi:carboxyl-terminal processing protease